MTNQICIGQIVAAHGIRGEVKIQLYLETPSEIERYKEVSLDNGDKIKLSTRGLKKEMVIAQIQGINDRNAAEELKGQNIYVGKNELPEKSEEQFYYSDLIGMKVVGNNIKGGIVKNVFNHGASDVLEIETDEEDINIPFDEQFIKEVDENRRVVTLYDIEYME